MLNPFLNPLYVSMSFTKEVGSAAVGVTLRADPPRNLTLSETRQHGTLDQNSSVVHVFPDTFKFSSSQKQSSSGHLQIQFSLCPVKQFGETRGDTRKTEAISK